MSKQDLPEQSLQQFSQLLQDLETFLGFSPGNKKVFLEAMTHDSYHKEINPPWSSNERLEFLGDSVLGLVISTVLFKKLPEAPEGTLAQIKAHLVSCECISGIALTLGLGKYMLLGKGEIITGGRERHSMLADCYEALLGAVFLDQGFKTAEQLILGHFEKLLDNLPVIRKNSKSLLQEETQKYFKTLPVYSVIKEEGPPHNKTFFVRVYFRDELLGEGTGHSKKDAELTAADMALENFRVMLRNLEPPSKPAAGKNEG